jgi:glycosyltransferase involved in cell wall biosynthesis
MRVALVHDWLTGMRGGERVLHQLAQIYPDADLYTLFHIPGATSPEIEKLRIHASPLSSVPGAARHYRKLLPLFPWAIRRFELNGYELVISCSHAVAKSVRIAPDTPHLCYCLTPMRYVWNHADSYLGRGALRTAAWPLVAGLRAFDRRTSGPDHITRFTAISRAVASRIRHCYDREARVVHPPVDIDRIHPNRQPPEAFYLLLGGFVPYKREDLAIEAFRRLRRRLVVAGDGPLRARLEAGAPDNVEFVGRVSDGELADLYASCRALIYPQEEDFGIAAVEVQAAGRPVIAFAGGGALDTVIPLERDDHWLRHERVSTTADGVPGALDSETAATGMWFAPQTPEALIEAVLRFEKLEPRFETTSIRRFAEGFGPKRFRREFEREIELTLAFGK